jgi:thiosulfate/3-mercaptopyruvate sulfurtransferase
MTSTETTQARHAEYAHPENAGNPGVVIVESDEDVLLYETGHIPGSVKLDWHTELNDPVTRDYVDGAGLSALLSAKGISRNDTLVIYGDRNNWWAAYALWVLSLFGHEDVRLMDGGRDKWVAEGRDLTRDKTVRRVTQYPAVDRDDATLRAFLPQVRSALGQVPLIDVRSPQEYSGERTHMPDYPEEGALRGGHIPTAASVPWAKAVADDGTFRPRAELASIYLDSAGLAGAEHVITYCRIGERSAHTWFVLTHLLGLPDVRNYDGSWTEWGNAVGVPIALGAEPGAAPAVVGAR